MRDLSLVALLRESLADPTEAFRALHALRLSRATLLEAAALLAILSALMASLLGANAPIPVSGEAVTIGPVAWAVVFGLSMVISAWALGLAGRALGGTGDFDGALLVTVWLDVVALVTQVVTVAIGLVLPLAAPLLGVLGLALLLWCLLGFAKALHGFDGLGRTVAAILLAGLGAWIGLTLVASLLLGLTGGLDA